MPCGFFCVCIRKNRNLFILASVPISSNNGQYISGRGVDFSLLYHVAECKIMPTLIAALLSGLASMMGSLVGRVLLALGIQYVTYTGASIVISTALDHAMANFTGLPSTALQFVAVFRVDECISILSGAFAASVSISGIQNGLTKLVHK